MRCTLHNLACLFIPTQTMITLEKRHRQCRVTGSSACFSARSGEPSTASAAGNVRIKVVGEQITQLDDVSYLYVLDRLGIVSEESFNPM